MRLASALGLAGLLLLTHGCSDGSSRRGFASTTAAATSAAPFALLATAPQDGDQGVDPDATLYATFDQDVDPTSLAPSSVVLLDDAGTIDLTLTLVGPGVLSARPVRQLAANKPHVLRLTTDIRSVAGDPLPAEVLVRFTTGAPASIQPTPIGTGPGPAVGPYEAGAAAVDVTPPVGVPLAGYGGGARRERFPDLNPFDYHTFLKPSTGVHDPIMAKALVLGNGHDRFCLVTIDAVATDADVVKDSVAKAAAQGFSVPLEKVLMCASHSHSGPGALSRRTFWQLTAADLRVQRVVDGFTDGIARAMVEAERALGPAHVGLASTQLTNATSNRRASDSPDLDPDDIDPELVAVRIDRPDGTAVATVWNFAIHGTHFGTDDHLFSADIMGSASIKAEAMGAGVAMFVNGAEGDIRPTGGYDATGQLIADAIMAARAAAVTEPQGVVKSVHEVVDLGQPHIDWSPTRNGLSSAIANAGWVQALSALGVGLHLRVNLPSGWVEREFRFQGVRIGRGVFASLPGEPIHTLGLELKRDGRAMGYDLVIPAALANGHGAYFTTATEFQYGGYEGLASFFGPNNGQLLLDPARRVMQALR